jgi:predicted glycogen debranching enzyme
MTAIRLGREHLGRLESATQLEWLVTNGIGGYAAGTVGGALTRRYHGLLIASLKPPVDRTLLLAKLPERVFVDGEWMDLDLNHWVGGTASPLGHLHLESFELDGGVPVWTYMLGGTRLEKRVWMEQGQNTTYVQYRLVSAPEPVTLSLRALVNYRDHHNTTSHGEWAARTESVTGGLMVHADGKEQALWLFAEGADSAPANIWYRNFALPMETERGLDDREDHLLAGEFTRVLEPGEVFTFVASTSHDAGRGALAMAGALHRRHAHERALVESWEKAQGRIAKQAPPWIRQLVLAADQFVVERSPGGVEALRGTPGAPRSVLAGYPWFTDWGRDTMIALPGLALTTGRPEIARAVLRLFAANVDRGMLPNYFPDDGSPAEYNTVDAALWFFQAVEAYVDVTGDLELLEEVYPALEDIGAWYERGTRFGIKVDPKDWLVTQGAEGVALTWMDARVEEWVVTPRKGKPVEINALWYNALMTLTRLARKLGRQHIGYDDMAQRVVNSFARFWNHDANCLYDVLDGPEGPDAAMRPNQLFACSLPDSPLDTPQRRAVVDAVGRYLHTSHGPRSLAPSAREYRGRMMGDRRTRDGAYHQGTVWTWLLPHYALAHWSAYGDRDAALRLLAPFEDLMHAMCLGTLPEVADGSAPHTPRGCVAQAWTVAETLRAWHSLTGAKERRARSNGSGAARVAAVRRRTASRGSK